VPDPGPPARLRAAAVIAPNYLPHARVLVASLRRQHPDLAFTLLLVHGGAQVDGARVLAPADVGVERRELHRRALCFDPQGLISSLRPLLLGHLLGEAPGPVLLLDVDMLTLAPLADLWALAERRDVLLSPHANAPIAGRPGAWPEEELLRAGTYSGALVGVGSGAGPYLQWMAERTARDCLRAPERGLFYSQTWLGLVPALFDHHVLRDEGINVQVHGLGTRDLDWQGDVPRLGSTPVRLFHFAGYDPSSPERLCRYDEDERSSLERRPGLRRLCDRYAVLLREAGWPAVFESPWRALPSGEVVDELIRSLYRAELLAAERGEQPEPPDPFDERDPDALRRWLTAPPTPGSGARASRYLLALHAARADLRADYPRVPGADEPALVAWAAGKAGTEIPAGLAPAR
jgi:hypothetical protein